VVAPAASLVSVPLLDPSQAGFTGNNSEQP
jgi:hypothetical protein